MIGKITEFIENKFTSPEKYNVYAHSIHLSEKGYCFIVALDDRDVLVADARYPFNGEEFSADNTTWKIAEETHENGCYMRELFPFTAPVSVMKKDRTFGVGDRLGIATPGHIRVFDDYDAFPVFAQQSIRELRLTGRNYETVLDCVSFAVFRENYTRGFGADGDHLKSEEEVQYAIDCGYSLITLDCSEHIRNDVNEMTLEQVEKEYIPNTALEKKYLGKTFLIEDMQIQFDKEAFMKMNLIYNNAIEFASKIYQKFFVEGKKQLDFEISIDETATPTTPAQHFYVANELQERGVKLDTMAPRFVGEFQKGIDYIGEINLFEKDFAAHAAIARAFGYRISVHSGSDKFSVFAIVGKQTHGCFHVKTAGTNWLEAMKIIAEKNPCLYRKCHKLALEVFEEAKKYYVVTTNLKNVPEIDDIVDEDLPLLFRNNDARQLIHITYGMLLNDMELREPLFTTWRKYQKEYADAIYKHIGKHLRLLYSEVEKQNS